MDKTQTQTPVDTPNFPGHMFSAPDSSFDVSKVKPHACMTDIVQRGNYIHCNTGNHGMRVPPGKILTQQDGRFALTDIVIQESPEPVVKKITKRNKK